MIRVQNLEAAVAAVGLDLESFALSARLSSHDAVTLAAGGALRATEATVRRVASALALPEGEILVAEHEGDGESVASAVTSSRREPEPDDGRSPLDHVVDRVCAEDGYAEEERDLVVSVLGAGTFPTHLTRSEIPAFLRVWFAAARELRAANALTHEALVAKVRAEGPRSAARMAEGIEKAMHASAARSSTRSAPAVDKQSNALRWISNPTHCGRQAPSELLRPPPRDGPEVDQRPVERSRFAAGLSTSREFVIVLSRRAAPCA